ncbi:MAG: hypothetical protein ACRDGA_01705 [Bacteroidota bacterium]
MGKFRASTYGNRWYTDLAIFEEQVRTTNLKVNGSVAAVVLQG